MTGNGFDMAKSWRAADEGGLFYYLDADQHDAVKALLQSLYQDLDAATDAAPIPAASFAPIAGVEGDVDSYDEFLLFLDAQPASSDAALPAPQAALPAAAADRVAPFADAVNAIKELLESGSDVRAEALVSAKAVLQDFAFGDWMLIMQAAVGGQSAPETSADPMGLAG